MKKIFHIFTCTLFILILFTDGSLPFVKHEPIDESIDHLDKYAIDAFQIRVVETGGVKGNPNHAVSVSGAIGQMQIVEDALNDWNKMHKHEKYTLADLQKKSINMKIGKWMLETRIPQILESKEIPISINHILIAYNWGAGHLVKWHKAGSVYKNLPDETQSYICKYWAKY